MDKINLLDKVKNISNTTTTGIYTRIVIHIDSSTSIVVGDTSGLTLEYNDPFGTQQQAVIQLTQLRNFQYRSYKAHGALLDPAAEIGDAIVSGNIYGGIYSRSCNFGRLMVSNISAPNDEELQHEYYPDNS